MDLTEEEKRVADELTLILSGSDADARYDALAGSRGGKILNADLARELSPRYQSPANRIAFTRATYPPCSRYVLERLLRTLSVPSGQESTVLFLAGGAASGKTTSIRQPILDQADVVFDSNFAQPAKAKTMIDAALGGGWLVEVVYIHRNYRLAVEGMLTRAAEDGRYIPLRSDDGQDLATLHVNAQRTIIEIASHYTDDDRVLIQYVRNAWTPDWTPDKPGPVTPISLRTLAPGGKRHYTHVGALYAEQHELVDRFLREGRLSPPLVAALKI